VRKGQSSVRVARSILDASLTWECTLATRACAQCALMLSANPVAVFSTCDNWQTALLPTLLTSTLCQISLSLSIVRTYHKIMLLLTYGTLSSHHQGFLVVPTSQLFCVGFGGLLVGPAVSSDQIGVGEIFGFRLCTTNRLCAELTPTSPQCLIESDSSYLSLLYPC
jgi:hypothetical protein